ncbi:RNA-binding S4 domain-containing protein [Mycoplasma todarodis]|uniref:RNA-binding protein n=1 Tax=Mycoplasma todarodis TaxID=1937191 RepID=A0A4R0XP18_9MOLU|nr:RNA-binding S4 domain-containing protein [Mycoplasma todarodis]TCG11252.1 RNA-binding protein [Mycoplasma todarodis]
MKIEIIGEYIKLGQLLKKLRFTHSGGAAKVFIERNKITINGKEPEGRGSKIRPGDTLWINDQVYLIKLKKED